MSQTFRALSLKSLQTTRNASTHILFLSLGLEPTKIVGHSVQILFKGHKNQGVVKEWFLCKRQTGFQSLRNSEKRSTEDQKLSFGSQTVEIFPNCSNNVRFPTKTSQLSTTKRDECNRSVGCARWVSQNDLCIIEHPKTSKSISSTDDIRSNQNYKLRPVHLQSFQVELGSFIDDVQWNPIS